MSLFKHFGTGISAYNKALSLIFSKGLWWFFVFPIVLNVLMMIASWFGIVSLADAAETWTNGLMNFDADSFFLAEHLQSSSAFIASAVGWTVWLFSKILFFVLYGLFGGYIIIILMSPVFAILSEKTEEILTGNNYPFNADQMIRDVVRGIMIAFRNMFIELAYMIAIFVLSFFIPVLGGIIGTIILFFIASYFYGFAFIDYTNERRSLSLKQSVQFIRANKGLAIRNGFVFALAMFIPMCGTLIAGFVAIVSVVAATIATHKIVDLSKNSHSNSIEKKIIDNIELSEDEKPKQIDGSTED